MGERDEQTDSNVPEAARALGNGRPRLVLRRIAALGAVAALALGAAACGGDDGTSGAAKESAAQTDTSDGAGAAGVEEAEQKIEAARAVPEFEAPGPAFDSSKAQGKTVYFIANALSIPFTKSFTDNAKEALESAGVKMTLVDMKSEVSEAARLIDQGVSVKADLIVIQKPAAKLVKAPLAKAKAAGIPVISLFEADPRLPPPEQTELGVTGEVTFQWTRGGELLADYVIADSGGKAKGVTYWLSDDVDSGLLKGGQEAEFAKLCPDCEMAYKDLLQNQWADRLPTMTRSDLTGDYQYWTPHYDGMFTFMLPAMKAGGADGLKLASFNSSLPQMKDLKNGDIQLLVGSPTSWLGYGVADQALRILSGEDPVADEHVPLRVFDETNIDSVDLSKPEEAWYVTDFKSEYQKLWGVE
jgi:ribose transport system substrate-binding protein